MTLNLYPEEEQVAFEQLRQNLPLLPPKIPSFYKNKVLQEVELLGHLNGPLYKTVFPTKEKIQLKAPGEVADFIDDRKHIPKGTNGTFLHKYANRILFMPTSICLGHCMYCFRQDLLEEQHETREKQLEKDLFSLISYLNSQPQVEEIILSGGDPLMLSIKDLEMICEKLSQVKQIKHFRIHTRAPVFDPKSFSDKKMELLVKYNFRFVLHVIHPYELCQDLLQVLSKARSKGLRLYNQFPLLRGVNDHPKVLIKLLTNLDEAGIKNLSIFLPEPVHHSATFRISYKRIYQIVQEVQNTMPSWISSTRFCQDTSLGKVRLEQRVPSPNPNEILFERDQQVTRVPDFPIELDIPGNLNNLLWKDFQYSV